jgi:hypothetical protein
MSRMNERASTKNGRRAAVGLEGRSDVTLHVQGRCSRTGSPAYRQSSRHPPGGGGRRQQGGASGRGHAAGGRGIGGAAAGAAFRGRRRGVGPAWPEELGSDRSRERERESESEAGDRR